MDDAEDDLPDVGTEGILDPQSESIEFREDPLSILKLERLGRFDQSLSDIKPIRIIRRDDGKLLVQEGNHRVFAARRDGLRAIKARFCSLAEWEAACGSISQRRGNDNPGLQN